MKWSDFFKKIGLNIDEEMEGKVENNKDTSDKTSDVNNMSNKNNSDNKSDDANKEDNKTDEEISDNNKEKEDEQGDEQMDLKFDDKTGLFDISDIKDEGVKSVLQRANDYTVKTANNVKIDKAFNEKMSSLKIRKGITADAVKKLINFDDIKVEGDKVIGIDEAFENLQKEQSGLFVQRNQADSNPVLEGFNPVQNSGNDVNSLDASLASLAASLSNGSN
jgi:hypothetical protein